MPLFCSSDLGCFADGIPLEGTRNGVKRQLAHFLLEFKVCFFFGILENDPFLDPHFRFE